MATTTTPVYRRPRLRILRVVAFVLSVILLAALGICAWVYSMARSALPQLNGRLRVVGLSAPVTVVRDGHGVPTIDAANFDDLFFAQGYVTAQDRLFQMDGMRRFAAGELAEVFGSDYLEHDRQQRILGLRAAARKTIEIASAEDRSHFEAYARGVNAYIEAHRERLPLEFRILRYSPRLWTPEDSALIGAQMVEDLSTSPRHALVREKILAKLGPELTADLYVNSSWHDRPPTVSRPSLDQEIKGSDQGSDQNDDGDEDDDSGMDSSVTGLTPPAEVPALPPLPKMFFDERPLVLGSNNWVVSGAHTVSGKPLLSNDMHLGHQMPNLWYEAHLRCKSGCGTFDVAGVTLPGYPYVIVGHNQRIAWGFTNLGPTVEDLYVETFNSDGQYLTPDGWKLPEHRREVIHAKDKPDVVMDVLLTRHGPIITDMVPGETRRLALRWTLYDGVRSPFFAVDSAQKWEEFRRALSELDAPGQNVVYADVDGNIGYQATGKIPIRAAGDGSLPENGSDNAHEWVGYVPFEKLPSIFNPSSGIIATANSRITPDGYRYSLSTEWEAPWRSARIYRVLESGKKFSAADMLALETDIYSELDRFFGERFVYAVDHAKNPSARAKAAAEIMRQWDGRMIENSAAPTIAVRARQELVRLLLEPKLGVAPKDPQQVETALSWKSYRWMMSTVWLETVVQHQPKRWLPEAYANYDELLTASVEAAVDSNSGHGSDAPQDLNSWNWGDFHPLEIQHPIFSKIPFLRHWAGPGLQRQSGSEYTVKAVSRSHGPSERMTVDLANLDQSTLNLVTGEAGNLFSPYFMDQWSAWYEGFTFAWPFSGPAVEKARAHELVLEP
ncbi:MAG TPA: penicillin acylase family protein [Terriglobales bacterium]|nr:penicillin acylase family protein [Terriglobales bacterium]